jgi:hypothetical protein
VNINFLIKKGFIRKRLFMNKYKIAFRTDDFTQKPEPFVFDCVTHGFADNNQWTSPGDNKSVCWNEELQGSLLSGNYDEVLSALKSLGFKPKCCIAIFKKNEGVELFINNYSRIIPDVILAGGVAAFINEHGKEESKPEEIRLLAVSEGSFKIESLNIYRKTGIEVEIKKISDRDFDLLRIIPGGSWQNGADLYSRHRKILNIPGNNFESLTFSDRNERNLHFSIAGNTLHSGADLPEDDILGMRHIINNKVEEKVSGFISDERSLIFGCAGIRSLIKKPLLTGRNSLAGFMFGEIVAFDNKAAFGNLMLTKIKILENPR